jgi:hypothetical protein
MRCHWHLMHGACGIVDTACTKKLSTKFEKLKSYAKQRWYAKNRRTIRTALAAFKGNIYKKNIYVPELCYPTTKKYINLKGLPYKNFSCMRCHWHRMHDFCVRKSIISRRIRNRIQKFFSPWIRGPGGIVWWKKPRVENLVTLSL